MEQQNMMATPNMSDAYGQEGFQNQGQDYGSDASFDANAFSDPNMSPDAAKRGSRPANTSSPSLMKSVQDKSGQLTNNIASKAKSTFAKYYSNKGTIIIGLIVVMLICVFVGYGLYVLISSAIFNQSKLVIEETKIPVLGNQPSEFSITSFNKSGNGKRRSYTFWIYIHDMNRYAGSYKHVWHIGNDGDDIKNASPIVFLDAIENKLYFRLAATNDTFTANLQNVQSLTPSQLELYMQQGIIIPYIPIQRWVHIAIVVNENSNGGSIVAYVDGDISNIVRTGEFNGTSSTVRLSNLNLDKMGNLYVGGALGSSFGTGFSGLISKVTIYNYDLNDKDIYASYNEGPLNGFLAALGIANYGLRSPVYRIA